ncbi:MAG: amidohydrolase family protein, partial [Bacteroidota bacterium]
IMDRDGENKRQITQESFRLLNQAIPTPDGNYLLARKHFTSTRSLGAGEIWMFHLSGGKGIQLTKRKNDQQDAANDLTISPDGRYVYFSEDMSGGKFFQYNKDPNGQIYVIKRFDRETGELSTVTGGAGGACRPQVSPDGKRLAFVRRVREKSVLFLHDLETGEEWPLYDGLSKDQQETWAVHGVYPNFAWLPDNQHLVFYAKGKLRKLNLDTKVVNVIPFEAEVELTMMDAVNFKQEIDAPSFTARMIRHATTSPDGKLLAFNAAGYLYLKQLPDGKPYRLTNQTTHWEFFPTFSPDGTSLVYTTWQDTARGYLWLHNLESPETPPTLLTPQKGIYLRPSFSQDGKKLVFEKSRGNLVLGTTYAKNPGIYVMDLATQKIERVQSIGRDARFSADGKRIYFLQQPSSLKKSWHSLDLTTRKVQTLFTTKYASQFVPSPDEQWLAFTDLFQVYLIPFPKSGASFELSGKAQAVPVRQLSKDAGTCLHWSADGNNLHWVLGERYMTLDMPTQQELLTYGKDSTSQVDTAGISIGLTLDADLPKGKLVLANGRIITMDGDKVIEKGYVVIENNRITKVKEGEYQAKEGEQVIDCTDKTLMPGLIDVHAHLRASGNGITPTQQWSYLANLAYGVTTTHDPSINTEMVFSQAEMVRSGRLLGPRIYSTGTILYGADGDFKAVINSIEDARSHLRRLKAVGAFSVKSYNQPRREQRQQVLKAARELRMMVYPEGGSTFYHNMNMVMDGHTGIEHSVPVNPLYTDVVQMWNASKTGYTPTLIVGYGGIWGENYWYDHMDVWKEELLLNFVPRPVVDARARRRVKSPEGEYTHIVNSQGCKKLYNGGTKVQLGAHGQLQGLGAHWELWMLEQGGMTEMEALRCATQYGADYIGMGDDLGSITKGKLADIVVLDANPLEDIQHSTQVTHVVMNGRIYEASTLTEIGNYSSSRPPLFWETDKSSQHFEWFGDEHGFEAPGCSCFGVH